MTRTGFREKSRKEPSSLWIFGQMTFILKRWSLNNFFLRSKSNPTQKNLPLVLTAEIIQLFSLMFYFLKVKNLPCSFSGFSANILSFIFTLETEGPDGANGSELLQNHQNLQSHAATRVHLLYMWLVCAEISLWLPLVATRGSSLNISRFSSIQFILLRNILRNKYWHCSARWGMKQKHTTIQSVENQSRKL